MDRVKQVAKYAAPAIAAAVAANKLGSMAFRSSAGQRAASKAGNFVFGKATEYIARELARNR